MAASRFRLQFKFWLNINKADESALADQIDELKQAGSFSRAVRDGIRLVVDLWRGRVEVLLELFPWVEDYFYNRFSEQQAAIDPALMQQLAKLEQLLIEQGNKPVLTTTTRHKTTSTPEQPDDETPQLVIKKDTKTNSSQNFLNSLMALQGN